MPNVKCVLFVSLMCVLSAGSARADAITVVCDEGVKGVGKCPGVPIGEFRVPANFAIGELTEGLSETGSFPFGMDATGHPIEALVGTLLLRESTGNPPFACNETNANGCSDAIRFSPSLGSTNARKAEMTSDLELGLPPLTSLTNPIFVITEPDFDPVQGEKISYEAKRLDGASNIYAIQSDPPTVPEPGTLFLLSSGLIGTARHLRRRITSAL